jgi:cellulose synthase/poly-beta-1,6-N-acetylglucosamine synthase-like glycosyltransferase
MLSASQGCGGEGWCVKPNVGSEGGGESGRRCEVLRIESEGLDAARLGFHRVFPARSAKRRLHFTQALFLALAITGVVRAAIIAPDLTFAALHVFALLLFAAVTLWRLFAASNLSPLLSRIATATHWPTYTILCPLYREANVVGELAAALDRLDYPKHAMDVKLIVEEDDKETLGAAVAAAEARRMEVVIVPAAAPRTKPKALNAGLALARGEYVAVYDAEDRPHPLQLRAALTAFEDGGERLACVQATLAIDNAQASWIARQFAAEYAIQFHEMLPLLARLRLPLPLGGSSNHFRANVLRASGGWDPYNVTEDADIGYRLARNGYHCGVISPPTWEEAPVSFAAWLNQRTRWIKGHLQTWLVLMRNPLRSAHDMGLRAFASMQLVLAGGVLAALAHGPLALIVLAAALSPQNILGPADFVLALSGYCVGVFTALTAAALSGNLSHVRAALTMPLYWPLLTIAALRAMFELVVRPHHWAKTAHGVSSRPGYSAAAPSKHVSAS